MFYPMDYFESSDEFATDGAVEHRQIPFHLKSEYLINRHQTLPKSSGTQLSSDSGFVSAVHSEDLSSEALSATTEQLGEMKICNTSSYATSSSQIPSSSSCIHKSQQSHKGLNNLGSQQSSSSPIRSIKSITFEDLFRQDEDGDTPLHLAVLQGFIEVVFSLVRIFPEPCFLDITNKHLQTPLHLAVLTNQAPLVRRLVVGGASVQCRDLNGNTPLHLACRDGHTDCVKALCLPISQSEHEVALLHLTSQMPPPQPLPQDLEQRNYDGQMPLHLAAVGGHFQIVQLLYHFGANVNAFEAKYGRTALHYAVERRLPDLVHYLVAQCSAKLEAETFSGYSAYQLAAVTAPMLAVLLVQFGAQQRPLPAEVMSSESEGDGEFEEKPICNSASKFCYQDSTLYPNSAFHLAA